MVGHAPVEEKGVDIDTEDGRDKRGEGVTGKGVTGGERGAEESLGGIRWKY